MFELVLLTAGDLDPQGSVLRQFWLFITGEGGAVSWAGARDAAEHPAVYRTPHSHGGSG